ncbi:hypothetical protein IAS59_004978 [Cryptococcus gattii]
MTLSKCASYCQSAGLILAAVEYSSQCYCSSVLNNGASLTKTSNACTMACAGVSSSICGGPDALTLMILDSAVSKLNSDFTSAILSLPPGWSAASTTCIQENTTGRALPSLTYASDDMTIETCCYCADALFNGASLDKPSSACTMPCAADNSPTCGGGNAVQLYVNPSLAQDLTIVDNYYHKISAPTKGFLLRVSNTEPSANTVLPVSSTTLIL